MCPSSTERYDFYETKFLNKQFSWKDFNATYDKDVDRYSEVMSTLAQM